MVLENVKGEWAYMTSRVTADLHFTRDGVYLTSTEETSLPRLSAFLGATPTQRLRDMVNKFSVNYSQVKDAKLFKRFSLQESLQRRFAFRYSTGPRLIDVKGAVFYLNEEQFERAKVSLPGIIPSTVKLDLPKS